MSEFNPFSSPDDMLQDALDYFRHPPNLRERFPNMSRDVLDELLVRQSAWREQFGDNASTNIVDRALNRPVPVPLSEVQFRDEVNRVLLDNSRAPVMTQIRPGDVFTIRGRPANHTVMDEINADGREIMHAIESQRAAGANNTVGTVGGDLTGAFPSPASAAASLRAIQEALEPMAPPIQPIPAHMVVEEGPLRATLSDYTRAMGIPPHMFMVSSDAPRIFSVSTDFASTGSDRSAIAVVTPQERQVRTLNTEQGTAVDSTVRRLVPDAIEDLDKLIKVVQNFYFGYEEGLKKGAANGNAGNFQRVTNVLAHWHGLFCCGESAQKLPTILREAFSNDMKKKVLDELLAIKNGENPYNVEPPRPSQDVIDRFIVECATLMRAKALQFHEEGSMIDNGVAPIGIKFVTEDVELMDDRKIPIKFNKFAIIIAAYDFGYACGDTQRNVDRVCRIKALTPHFPRRERGTSWSHPHVEGTHLCFGEGLATAGNLMRNGLIADLFQYIERILMTYGRSPYISLDNWSDMDRCDICTTPLVAETRKRDPHADIHMCPNCTEVCGISKQSIDKRYIKPCATCNTRYDSRRYHGRNQGSTCICANCVNKEIEARLALEAAQREAARVAREAQRAVIEAQRAAIEADSTVAFPVVAPTPGCNCPSCGATLGEINLSDAVFNNTIVAFDEIMNTETCKTCDPSSVGLSDAVCQPGMREAYLMTLLQHFVPQAYIMDLVLVKDEDFEEDSSELEDWESVDWYETIHRLRSALNDHGTFRSGLTIEVVADTLCRLAHVDFITAAPAISETPSR